MTDVVVLACGSRYWGRTADLARHLVTAEDELRASNERLMTRLVVAGLATEHEREVVVVHGDAPGADRLAAEAAAAHGLTVRAYPADWDRYGKGAGPRRNQQMLDECHPDLVIAFTNDLRQSAGTRDMVRRARHAAVPVYVIGSGG